MKNINERWKANMELVREWDEVQDARNAEAEIVRFYSELKSTAQLSYSLN